MSILDFKWLKNRKSSRQSAPNSATTSEVQRFSQRPSLPLSQPVMTPEEAAETWFARLRDLFVLEFGAAPFERTAQRYLIESGMLDSDRPFVYLQPLNQQGFLFERAGTGWVIGRADKIVAKDTFMRGGEAWDVVNVISHPDAIMPKVSSQRFQDQLMPFSEYRQRLVEAVRCGG